MTFYDGMVMAIPTLIAELRARAGKYDEYDWHGGVERQAADALEKLTAEYEGWPDEEPAQQKIARLTRHLEAAKAVIERQEWEIHNLNTLLGLPHLELMERARAKAQGDTNE